MSLSCLSSAKFAFSFPRVSGDEPEIHMTMLPLTPFSPRERG